MALTLLSFPVVGVNMKTVADTTLIPAATGKFFLPYGFRFTFTELTGATGNPQISVVCGAAGGTTLVVATTIDRAVTPFGTVHSISITDTSNLWIADLANPVILKVLVAATGTTITGRASIYGEYY
jgi:hypothetical protein